MQFDLPFYEFLCCKCSLEHLVDLMAKNLPRFSHFTRQRTCPFSMDLLNAHFIQDGSYHHQPTYMMMCFVPKVASDFSIAMVTGCVPFYHWFGRHDPLLEMMNLRFTTESQKSPDKIRELGYYHGIELIRMVRVMTDPRWKLCVLGEQQPFEYGKTYEKIKGKRIKDYFTQDDMIHFATHWGCPITQDDFWASDRKMHCWGNLENDENLAAWCPCPRVLSRPGND